MPFYVIGSDGNRYGPGEMPDLAAWASEDRIRPETELEETSTGIRMRADSVLEDFAWSVLEGAVVYPRPAIGQAAVPAFRKVWVAGLLTFLLCGAGQMYNRQIAKGFAFLLVCLTVGILTNGPGGYAITGLAFVDACRTARRLNSGQVVGPWSLF